MPEYLSPGVYVEEVDRGPKPIEGVGTAMAAFIGFTEKAEMVRDVDGEQLVENLLNRPQLVTNWTQYVERYGNFVPGAYMPQSVYGYFMNGGSRCYVVSVRTFPKAETTLLNQQGKPALTVRSRLSGTEGMRLRVRVDDVVLPTPAPAGKKSAKDDEEKSAEDVGGDAEGGSSFTLFVEQEKTDSSWKVVETLKEVQLQDMSLNGEKKVQVAYKNNKFSKLVELVVANEKATVGQLVPKEQEQVLVIEKSLLPPPTTSEFQGDVTKRSGVEGLEVLDDVTMVCVPDLMTVMPGQKLDLDMVKGVQSMMIAHCEHLGDRVAILDAPPNMSPQEVKNWRMNVAGYDSSYAALYYPWI